MSECKKRGITVASFGADGDSRELKAMQVSTSLLATQSSSASLSPSMGLKRLDIPPQWSSWFAAKKPTAIAYVQDTVHVAVKLKSRLIKPSIVLPLGKYLAGVHHLRQIQHTFGKDQHGLREKDLNHKDKQNFDAVLHLSSESVLELLAVIPDAKGTKAYLEVIQCVIVDKKVDNISRLEKAWYAVFFVRYWRQWLMLSPQYTLSNNFITTNAYVCIELNAHALITHLMTIRDTLPVKSFLPWLLGSQSCERIFRTARSLSSTFSTIINFGMLGLLRRLHRIHIQFCLEAESPNTGITYPRVEKHKKKSGQHNSYDCSVQSIANEDILEAIKHARERAKKTMEALGIKSLLQ